MDDTKKKEEEIVSTDAAVTETNPDGIVTTTDIVVPSVEPEKEEELIPGTRTKEHGYIHKYQSHRESRRQKIDAYREEQEAMKAEKALLRRKKALQRAANKYHKAKKKGRNSPVAPNKLKVYDSQLAFEERELNKEVGTGALLKIIPSVEKLLFPYYVSGASLRAIQQQFGQKWNFGLQALYAARDFYKWEARREAILKVAHNSNDCEMANRYKEYLAFFDDLLSEAIIRFTDNSRDGRNGNPFETLKATNIKDLKDLVEMITQLHNNGVKKFEFDNKHEVKLSSAKQSKLLEILAEDDEEKK